ncbi:TPA: capsule biosynthesis GfcC family protein [Stenotrophomonas maltophilia]|jgi:hypothetical protein|uniref:capsule biosynthesis GfcC family protein n=1 Tax=Stenotrophomonas maltophilia TaxID=40324 RepID=UPI0021D81202|nr:capsule biosynthesis GfcC family protein [Stenotrophomonas maltophilia]UXY49864.1 capsule biosynthesis GfcC family protein [Stenotrophomonas maltophilia]
MKQRLIGLTLGLTLANSALAAPPISVDVSGHVRAPGVHSLASGARISAAALAAAPDEQAYMLGAALLRTDAVLPQTRLKAGLLFDLQTLAALQDDTDVAEAADRMAREFNNLPVTGREVQLLEPRSLEAARRQDRPARAGDRLIYPSRPQTVTVTGAVAQPCAIPHVAMQDARIYRSQCALLPAASPDDLYVIQPDGRAAKIGIALWNRSAPVALAPGAVIYVPIAGSAVRSIAPDINDEAARFLATQVLDAPGVSN